MTSPMTFSLSSTTLPTTSAMTPGIYARDFQYRQQQQHNNADHQEPSEQHVGNDDVKISFGKVPPLEEVIWKVTVRQ